MDHDMKNPVEKRKKLKCVPFLSLLLSIFPDTTDGRASLFCHRRSFLLPENNKGTVLFYVINMQCTWFLDAPGPLFRLNRGFR
jgi:hypothetical protein